MEGKFSGWDRGLLFPCVEVDDDVDHRDEDLSCDENDDCQRG
jgi:hypothetical protein